MSQDSFNIEIANEQTLSFEEDGLIAIASSIFQDHDYQSVELSIAVVDDPTIRKINNEYLAHDYETDVISFVLDETDDSLTGQLVVSTDTAREKANEFGTSLQQELMLYVAHGTLHLVGFDDTDDVSAAKMRQAEKRYLEQFSIPHRWSPPNSDLPESAS